MAIKSVVLLGADGKLGPSILQSLVANGFDVTVLKRKSSKSQTPHPKQVLVSDAFEVDELVEVLKGQDAVVVTIKGSETMLQKRIADACIKAGVKRKIFADSGVSYHMLKLSNQASFLQISAPWTHQAHSPKSSFLCIAKRPSYGNI